MREINAWRSGRSALAAIPPVPAPTAVSQIELQAEVVRSTQGAVNELAQASTPAQRDDAAGHLRQLQTLSREGVSDPVQARATVRLLRNGEWASLARPLATPSRPVATAPAAPAASPSHQQLAQERQRIRGEITGLRQELCRVQTNLRRFSATIQTNENQRAEWEGTVNDAYNSALDRAKDKLTSFATDFPEEMLRDRLRTVADPAERVRVQRALDMMQHLKEALSLRDFSAWANNQSYSRDDVIEGIGMIADIIDVEGAIKTYLTERWGLARVIAFQEAASDLVTSAYDVTAEVVAWRRLNQINRNSEGFRDAVAALSRHQREVMAQIHDREVRLGLPPGSTRENCP